MKPWFTMHGECPFIFYVCILNRQSLSTKPRLALCLCPIWEYQQMFTQTYANNNMRKHLDYAWSGSIIFSRWCDLDSRWERYHLNHKTFFTNRPLYCTQRMVPEDALRRGIINMQNIKGLEEFQSIKQYWTTPPPDFESALNWKAFDDEYFMNSTAWPAKDAALSKPRDGYY